MTTTVKAADAAQFVALVPRMLGYAPTRSLVVIPMGRGRSLGAMRFDLPPDPAPSADDDARDDGDDGFAATVVGMVCRIAIAEGFIAVAYSDAGMARPLPHAALARDLGRAAHASGLTLFDVFVVGADGWTSALADDPMVRPLSELVTVPHGDLPPVQGDQTTGARLPRPAAADRRKVASAHRSLVTALAVVCGLPPDPEQTSRIDPAALEAVCALDDLPTLFEESLSLVELPPMRVALLSWCLARPALRDVALVQWASDTAGGEAAVAAQRRWEDGEEYPVDLAAVMWGEGARPDPARLAQALELAREVAALTPTDRRAGALSVCAWLAWALGRSTHADVYAREAREADPDHGLAEIVRSFVASAHLPDWAFERGTTDAP